MKRKFICILLSMSFIMMGCSKNEKERPQLIIGYDDYCPFNYINDQGKQDGIDALIAKEACKRMGYEPVFKAIEWDKKEDYLENHEIDCIWSCFSMNNREEDYAWVGPYMNARQVVAVLEDSDFYTMRDLDNKTIDVKITTQPEKIFLAQEEEDLPKFSRVYSLSNVDEVAIALRDHYVDAVSGYSATLIHLFEQNHVRYRFIDQDVLHAKLGVAFLKGDTSSTKSELEKTLKEMLKDGTIENILNQYGLDVEKALGGIGNE